MSTINLTTQTSVAISTGDILQLPNPNTVGQVVVFVNVGGAATIRPPSGGTVDNSTSDYSVSTGNYIISTTGGQGSTWSVFVESSGGPSNAVLSPDASERELVAGTGISFDISTPGELEINASGGGGTLQHVQRTLTSAEILDLHNTPIELIPAPGAGKMIQIMKNSFRLNYNSIAYTPLGLWKLFLEHHLLQLQHHLAYH